MPAKYYTFSKGRYLFEGSSNIYARRFEAWMMLGKEITSSVSPYPKVNRIIKGDEPA